MKEELKKDRDILKKKKKNQREILEIKSFLQSNKNYC
jgi:hypothetical protein